jgi:hypothetical protein
MFGLRHFDDYLETTRFRRKFAIDISRFHFDFYFSFACVAQCLASVALLCLPFDGSFAFTALRSISIYIVIVYVCIIQEIFLGYFFP